MRWWQCDNTRSESKRFHAVAKQHVHAENKHGAFVWAMDGHGQRQICFSAHVRQLKHQLPLKTRRFSFKFCSTGQWQNVSCCTSAWTNQCEAFGSHLVDSSVHKRGMELCQVKAETHVEITSKTPAAKALDILGRMHIAVDMWKWLWAFLAWSCCLLGHASPGKSKLSNQSCCCRGQVPIYCGCFVGIQAVSVLPCGWGISNQNIFRFNK